MLRVLVADDDATTVSILETLLRGEGHLVQSAPNGRAALDRVKSMLPDVLVTDVEMPGLTGNQLVAAVRADPAVAGIYVIVLTVHGARSDKMKSLLSGADDFMVKGARPEEIIGRVEIAQRVVQSRRESREALRRHGAPDSGSVAALEAVLGSILAGLAEGTKALESGDAGAAHQRIAEARASLERAIAALRTSAPPAP